MKQSRRFATFLSFVVIVFAAIPAAAQTHVAANDGTMRSIAAEELLVRPVTVDLQHVTLKAAIDSIAAKAKVFIQYYLPTVEAYTAPVTLRVNKVPLRTALERILSGTRLHVVPDGETQLAITETIGVMSAVQGGGVVVGQALDVKSKAPLARVAVVLTSAADAKTAVTRRTMTDGRGEYRIADLPPGTYTISMRQLGYMPQRHDVVVTSGTARLDVALDRSVTGLDQVVVTGSVAASEIKQQPTNVTVVTAKEIQDRGITQITQLFRGQVPGIVALNDNLTTDGSVTMLTRGRSSLTKTASQTPAIKTYIDGIELADPRYLNQIDVNSIDHIEIINGPQASTVYGSAAMNGVMQIFTKKGKAGRGVGLSASLQTGTIQNSFTSNYTPQHDYSLQLDGGDQKMTWQAGVGYQYSGQWTPGNYVRSTRGNIGLQRTEGPLDIMGSAQLSLRNQGGGQNDFQTVYYGSLGLTQYTPGQGLVSSSRTSTTQQNYGLTLTYRSGSWLTQVLSLGHSETGVEDRTLYPLYVSPSDSTTTVTISPQQRQSVSYNATLHGSINDVVTGMLTIGGDYWHYKSSAVNGYLGLSGGSYGASQLSTTSDDNHGGFVQTQLGLYDKAFLTLGLRAEQNTSFGGSTGYQLTPRYGLSVVQNVGGLSARGRVSYGRATRPPDHGEKDPFYLTEAAYGTYQSRLAAPDLLPEDQRGWDGGIDLYFGSRASLTVTRYDQTVRNSILNLNNVDSVRSLQPTSGAVYSYQHQNQYVNIASIRNRGWELQGSVNAGPLSLQGTYSATVSRVGAVPNDPTYLYNGLVPGGSLINTPEHTGSATLSYTTNATTATVSVSVIGENFSNLGDSASYFRSQLRLPVERDRWDTSKIGLAAQDAYATTDLSVQRRLTHTVTGVLTVNNLFNTYHSDYWFVTPVMGRRMMIGARINRR